MNPIPPDDGRKMKIKEFLDEIPFPETLDAKEIYERFEDMSPDGRLRLFIQQDGDVILSIETSEHNSNLRGNEVEFCTYTGGGQSQRVRMALLVLAEAIRLDNEEKPQHREMTK